ncbi:hypothetical protein A9G28_12660 [Gilliamella sp. Fer1-1]|nr:hypothetical protein A9G28_12660 [Gilliamella apicola]
MIHRIYKIHHKATIFEEVKEQIPKSYWLAIQRFDQSNELYQALKKQHQVNNKFNILKKIILYAETVYIPETF